MNLIPCTSDCIYQKQGECTLDRAVSAGQPKRDKSGRSCAYYIGRAGQKKELQ